MRSVEVYVHIDVGFIRRWRAARRDSATVLHPSGAFLLRSISECLDGTTITVMPERCVLAYQTVHRGSITMHFPATYNLKSRLHFIHSWIQDLFVPFSRTYLPPSGFLLWPIHVFHTSDLRLHVDAQGARNPSKPMQYIIGRK